MVKQQLANLMGATPESMIPFKAFTEIPVIETERLILRAFSLDDIPIYRKEFENEAVQRYLGGVLILKDNVKDAQNWLRNVNERLVRQKLVFTWLIVKKEDVSVSVGRIDEEFQFAYQDIFSDQEYGTVEHIVSTYGFIFGKKAIEYLKRARKTSIRWKFRVYWR